MFKKLYRENDSDHTSREPQIEAIAKKGMPVLELKTITEMLRTVEVRWQKKEPGSLKIKNRSYRVLRRLGGSVG